MLARGQRFSSHHSHSSARLISALVAIGSRHNRCRSARRSRSLARRIASVLVSAEETCCVHWPAESLKRKYHRPSRLNTLAMTLHLAFWPSPPFLQRPQPLETMRSTLLIPCR